MKPILWTVILLGLTVPAAGAEPGRSIDERFSSDGVHETPNFRKHVVPLIGKLGCNSRNCHGSFQGRGGFRLSLFGYDFAADHEALMAGDDPRVDLEVPAESLILEKPTLQLPHEGGKRMEVDSWQYRVLLNWVRGGAKSETVDALKLVSLKVSPSELILNDKGETAQLSVVAQWSDGTSEDVTLLSRYQTNNDGVAVVDESGLVTADERGDSHIVVFYDSGIVPVPVIRPTSDRVGPNYPDVPAPTKIDQLVVDKLRKVGITPSELSTDAEFLRRVSLDITGTLPVPSEIEDFLKDSSAEKRARKIDELLDRPSYAAVWTTWLCDVTGNNEAELARNFPGGGTAPQEWYDWIYRRVDENVPYDELVAGIVLARSRTPGQSYADYIAESSKLYYPGSELEYADRPGMDHYWARKNISTANERALNFAYAFLGVRIQCAECHKHPFDQWTQQDFKDFSKLFSRVRFGRDNDGDVLHREIVGKAQRGGLVKVILERRLRNSEPASLEEVFVITPKAYHQRKKNSESPKGRLLAGATVTLDDYEDPRNALMEWLRDPNNPYFARAFVNRVWASYFGTGIVDPPDDLSLANPPSNEALLDYLTRTFVDSGYDMKRLHREIANSRTYQLSWRPNDTNVLDKRNFSRALLRRLPAEVVYDSILQATASDELNAEMQEDMEGRAIAIPGASRRKRGSEDYALSVFGKSNREANCDCERSSEPSVLQAIYLKNDEEVNDFMLRPGEGWLDQMARTYGLTTEGQTKTKTKKRQRKKDDPPRMSDELFEAKSKARELSLSGKPDEAKAIMRALERKNVQERRARRGRGARGPAEEQRGPIGPRLSPDELVQQAYLRTLSRYPSREEAERSRQFLEESSHVLSGLKGLVWALLNTKEFIINH